MSEVLKESQITASSKYAELLNRTVTAKLALDHPAVGTSNSKKCSGCGTENRGTARFVIIMASVFQTLLSNRSTGNYEHLII